MKITRTPINPQALRIRTQAARQVRRGLDRVGEWLFPNPHALLGWQVATLGPRDSRMSDSVCLATASSSSGGGSIGNLETSRQKLSEVLKKVGHRDLSALDTVFPHLGHLAPKQREHNLRVAFQLAEWSISPITVAASLLAGSENIPQRIPAPVRTIIENRDRLNSFTWQPSRENQEDYFRSLLFLTAENHEVLLLLAAEDLIELRHRPEEETTAGHHRAERAFHVTSWILKFLGYGESAGELEDLAFLRTDPEHYEHAEQLQAKASGMDRAEALKKLRHMAKEISTLLDIAEIPHELKYRVKRVASGAKKIATRGEADAAHDINGLRIIITSNIPADCYQALFLIREFLGNNWENTGYRDYIATPKPNGYQSIHELFRDLNGYPLEIQFRTKDMDNVAEFGRASHAAHKTGEAAASIDLSGLSLPEVATARFEIKKGTMQAEGVCFVYDDQGILHKLVPADSKQTPSALDAAFAQGIKTGLHASGAQIDGEQQSLATPLSSGQRVSIQRGARPQTRGRAKTAKTLLARAVLQAANSGEINPNIPLEEGALIGSGKRLFIAFTTDVQARLLKTHERHFSLPHPTLRFSMQRVVRRMGFSDVDEFYITLSLLSTKERTAFLAKVETRILDNAVVVALQQCRRSTNIEVLLRDLPGLFVRILSLLEKGGLRLGSLESNPVSRSPYAFARLGVSLSSGGIDPFLSELENIYAGMLPASFSYAKTMTLRLRINPSSAGPELIASILRIVLRQRANIKTCSFPKPKRGEELYYELKIQLPPRGDKRIMARIQMPARRKPKGSRAIMANALGRELEVLRGIRRVTIVI